MLFNTAYASFLVAHQLLFCAVKVPEKYVTGLISLSSHCGWHRTPQYALLEASVYNTQSLLGSGNYNMGLLQNISLR